jgi:hypothetical protein
MQFVDSAIENIKLLKRYPIKKKIYHFENNKDHRPFRNDKQNYIKLMTIITSI